MNEKYAAPCMEILFIGSDDVVRTSCPDNGDIRAAQSVECD